MDLCRAASLPKLGNEEDKSGAGCLVVALPQGQKLREGRRTLAPMPGTELHQRCADTPYT